MPKPHSITTGIISERHLALCFQMPSAESATKELWVELIPRGTFSGEDGRTWHNKEPDYVITSSDITNIPWDIEHATHIKGPKGEPAPAQGWVEELQNRNGAIYGRVVFNRGGQEIISERQYRYYSPTFYFDDQGNVLAVRSVGFTNEPNLNVPALNRKEKTMPLPTALASALGLDAATATEADAVTAIGTLKSDKELALNRAQTLESKQPDINLYVPKETHQLALNRAQEAEQKLAELADAEIVALVDGAIEAGKIAPANKDMYLATCRAEGGREQFENFIKSAPVIANNQSKDKKVPDATKKPQLEEHEMAMCRRTGLTPDEYLATKSNLNFEKAGA